MLGRPRRTPRDRARARTRRLAVRPRRRRRPTTTPRWSRPSFTMAAERRGSARVCACAGLLLAPLVSLPRVAYAQALPAPPPPGSTSTRTDAEIKAEARRLYEEGIH